MVAPAGCHSADMDTESAPLDGADAGSVALALPGGAAPAAQSFNCMHTSTRK
jgi:hypothetical protein